jgi:hypothetical protein
MAKEQVEFNLKSDNLESQESKVDNVVVLKYTDSEAFFPEGAGITAKEFDAVAKHSKAYLNAVAEFAQKEAAEHFRKNEDTARINFAMPYGTSANSSVDVSVIRSKKYAGGPMTGGKDTIKSVIQVSVNEGSYKPTQKLLSSLADALTAEFVK